MGIYINPITGETKREWLHKYGVEIEKPLKWNEIPEGCLLICLIDNGFFDAAAILYSDNELQAVQDPRDKRRKKWFIVELEHLYRVEPSLAKYIGEGV